MARSYVLLTPASWCPFVLLSTLVLSACRSAGPTKDRPDGVDLLARTYVAGECIRYEMTGVQETRDGSFAYVAQSEGIVRLDDAGAFYEDTHWIRLEVDGEEVRLDPASLAFRQRLSLDPGYEMPFPDIRNVHPRLIGPIFDLMTFYVDLRPDLRTEPLVEEGDHVYVPHGRPNSWADGARVLIGEDAIDFSLTLDRVAQEEARLRVRHVPPPDAALNLPAAWMHERVSDHPNNWVQVVQVTDAEGTLYVAAVGSESFDVQITVDRSSGRILRAGMDNPVDVLERTCDDPGLLQCGEPRRYRIHREITVAALP